MSENNKADKEFDVTGELSEDCLSIILHHGPMLKRLIGALKGETLRVRFAIFRAKRSDAQNRYIHGVMVPTVRAWYLETQGEKKTHDEIYVWLRVHCLGHRPEIKDMMGEQVIVMTGKRFSKMNTKEFAEAVEDIVRLMDEKGCHILLPKQNNFIGDFLADE